MAGVQRAAAGGARARSPFPLLCFDDEPEALDRKFAQAAAALGLEQRARDEEFFAPDLRRAEATDAAPPDAQALYDELRALAL